MSESFNKTCYHGTSSEYASSIISSEFICNRNDKHWLGNGIYFFEDYNLANWWTSNPTKKFGCRIDQPVIIEAELVCENDKLCNTFDLSTYNQLIEDGSEFNNLLFRNGLTKENLTPEKIRCLFFDWVVELYGYNLVIGCFPKCNSEYINKNNENILKLISMPYIEVQYCVFDQKIVKSKKISTRR